MTDLTGGGFSPPGAERAACVPGAWDRNWNPKPGEPAPPSSDLPPPPTTPPPGVSSEGPGGDRLMSAAKARGGTGGGKAESRRGHSSRLLNTVLRGRRGARSTVHPGISQPESPPFLAAPEHSLWPTATEMRACQDTWRKKKTRHQKQNKTKKPRPRRGEEQTELLDQGHTRHPAACTPGKGGCGGGNTVQGLATLLKGSCCPALRPPTHWPSLSFFF